MSVLNLQRIMDHGSMTTAAGFLTGVPAVTLVLSTTHPRDGFFCVRYRAGIGRFESFVM